MQFVHQALTWGFLLALAPLLIHLINMMRHKRVQWAAMEFLLASYKKHHKWIWLKQLLLLLARIAVVALAVAMLAQLKTRDQWLAIFGGRVTHHFVLLDDSYSMSDRVAGESAMDAAKRITAAIVGRATQEDSAQKLTLLRYSQNARCWPCQKRHRCRQTNRSDRSGLQRRANRLQLRRHPRTRSPHDRYFATFRWAARCPYRAEAAHR